MDYALRFSVLFDEGNLQYLLGGIGVTSQITGVSFLIALVGGLLIALGQRSRSRTLSRVCGVYVEVFRNIPALVLLFWVYYGLGMWGLDLQDILAVSLALGLTASGFVAESFRTGLQAIGRDQRDAAAAIGLTAFQAYRKVVMPQALRVTLPLLINRFTGVFIGSALVAVLGVPDLTYRARDLATITFRPIEVYTAIAVYYLVVSSALAALARLLEERWERQTR